MFDQVAVRAPRNLLRETVPLARSLQNAGRSGTSPVSRPARLRMKLSTYIYIGTTKKPVYQYLQKSRLSPLLKKSAFKNMNYTSLHIKLYEILLILL